ncbi:Receptor-like protein kinase [Quillaja saponaria]|uniref:non-specific serine/threonine protein kinase n=1 Tax=Quillaja saponaria TaxID=32244 RepID=A0AAD7M5E7_QUISA|nr:Receptor-like protein kinase [Quillaja saponaria]
MTCLIAMSMTNFTSDQSALFALKSSLALENPHNILSSNWSTSSSMCTWVGVSCGKYDQRVRVLNLFNMSLSGIIPPQLGNLSFLVDLDLTNNNFHGHLPPELAKLHRLKMINLSQNMFSGTIPAWIMGGLPKLQHLILSENNFNGFIQMFPSNMSKLETLNLSANLIEGNIPSDIAGLSNLRFLEMAHNLLSGVIPSTIFNNSRLQRISLSFNNFVGQIPTSVFNISSLRFLSLRDNNFQGNLPWGMCRQLPLVELINLFRNNLVGSIPGSIGNCTALRILYLDGNSFTGSIPSGITDLSNVERLSLGPNNLTGLIPPKLFNISTLKYLYLSFNFLSGILPLNIGHGLGNMEGIYLAGNKLSGVIPSSISNASKLIYLDLIGNSFTGVIPDSLGNLNNIQVLNLGKNNLTSDPSTSDTSFLSSLTKCRQLQVLLLSENPLHGKLPKSLGNFSSSLQRLFLRRCKIMGSIPDEIGNLSGLITVELHRNDIEGSIPTRIKELKNLQQLDLRENRLDCLISDEFCQLKNLGRLALSDNKIHGLVPKCLGNLTSLKYLYIDFNNLTSRLPSALWSLKDILELDLSSNALIGSIPPQIQNLRAITKLGLSRNKISGTIPERIGSLLSLQFLDLSHNFITGMIPKSMETLIDLSYLNVSYNKLRGEIPDGGPFKKLTAQSFMMNDALCGSNPSLQIQPCVSQISHQRSTKKLIWLKWILPIILSAIIVLSIFIFFRYKKKHASDSIENESLAVGAPTQLTRISYYELLQATNRFDESNLIGKGGFGSVFKGMLSSESMIAVKVFNLDLEEAWRSFDVECEALRNVRHRNLIKVISSCSNTDFRALVMEFMPNGSLENWLYSHNYCLDFLQRLNIMIDVATGLEYLHQSYSTPIVHCDLKPSNVLLDEDMVAHVADFGISKLLDAGQSKTQTKTLATIGYIAPEYGSKGIVSPKGDVYSFGIMLMETFTRKKPTDDMFLGDLSLKSWVNESVPQATIQVVDSNLLRGEKEQIDAIVISITSIMELSLTCCVDSPEERINIKDVLTSLNMIKFKFMQAFVRG